MKQELEQPNADVKTWIEVSNSAIAHNIKIFKKLVGEKTKLISVVKSNAYGHGILCFPKIADNLEVDGFCVDSVVEGSRLRKEGIHKPILVLGATLDSTYKNAKSDEIFVTISNREQLQSLAKLPRDSMPKFHVKLDTGMHRQGFDPKEVPWVVRFIKQNNLAISGLYTHFASAKDINYPTYTEKQFAVFKETLANFEKAGFHDLTKHAAASGGTLIGKKYHLDWVRIGIGLYGLFPSKELEMQLPGVSLKPVLSWKTRISEIKHIKKGEYVGYDLAYRTQRATKIAILPIGYWHGVDRRFSDNGEVLINGKKALFIGRISMDMAIVDVTKIPCKVGDTVTLIGRDGNAQITATDAARRIGTIHYEFLTRLNPLIRRIETK